MQPAAAHHEFTRIAIGQHGLVQRIRLRNGRQNIIDFAMMEDLKFALHEVERHPETSVVLLEGEGENFSAGVDIPSHTPEKVKLMLSKFHGVIRAMADSRKVLVASVRGNCLGGGAELAMMCDIVLTTYDSKWGFPEIQLACFPPVAATALAAVVGQKRAAELVLTGRSFSGADAVEYGLANEALPTEEIGKRTNEYLEMLRAHSPAALGIAKRALYSWEAIHFEKGLARAEEIYNTELTELDDMSEGINAWIEKRKPKWSGE